MTQYTKLFAAILVAFIGLDSAWAYRIDGASYNRSTNTVAVRLVYETCGTRAHTFNWNFDQCGLYADGSLGVRLEDPLDAENPDTCDNPYSTSQDVYRNLSDLTCATRPFDLTIFAGISHRTLRID